jgi:2-polyprenyl-6-methoxyphenol hydroxylase-like FAD-dependent oxidoreductase
MAGLTAARVLAERFESVTVLDRDELPTEVSARKGVPQGRHPHALLAAGEQVLEGLFPGLVAELVAAGAVRTDGGADGWFFQFGGHRSRHRSGLEVTFMSRPLLEGTVRRRVATLPNVTLHPRTPVAGVRASTDHRRVVGVALADGGSLDADLVVDATGRNGSCLRSLRGLGFPEPPVTSIGIGMGYASRVLRRSPGDLPDGASWAVVIGSPPAGLRQGFVLPLEGDRWIVDLNGYFGDHAPTDDAGFLAYAESLPSPEIAEVLRRAEPLTDVVTHRTPSSQRRHFEKLRHVPAGYVAIGDVVCSFNPIYGQGMSSAALQAQALGRALDRYSAADPRLPRHHYRLAARVVANPWQVAATADLAYPQTTGRRPPGTALLNGYLERAVRASHTSPEVCDATARVQHLLAPPSSLLRPAVVARVVREGMRTRSTRPAGAPVVHTAAAAGGGSKAG